MHAVLQRRGKEPGRPAHAASADVVEIEIEGGTVTLPAELATFDVAVLNDVATVKPVNTVNTVNTVPFAVRDHQWMAVCNSVFMGQGVEIGRLSWCETDAKGETTFFPLRFEGDVDGSARVFFDTVIREHAISGCPEGA